MAMTDVLKTEWHIVFRRSGDKPLGNNLSVE